MQQKAMIITFDELSRKINEQIKEGWLYYDSIRSNAESAYMHVIVIFQRPIHDDGDDGEDEFDFEP